MMAKNIHQPAAHVTKAHAPAVTNIFDARPALPTISSANSQYATVKKIRASSSERKMTKKQIFTRSEHTRKIRVITPIQSRMNPKLALNPRVASPADAGSPAGAYAAYAPKLGFKVPPKEKKKAPKQQKTTEGKVLPNTHSSRPAMN